MSAAPLFYVDVERRNTVTTTYAVKADNIADACAIVDAAIKGDVLNGSFAIVNERGNPTGEAMIAGVRRGGVAP